MIEGGGGDRGWRRWVEVVRLRVEGIVAVVFRGKQVTGPARAREGGRELGVGQAVGVEQSCGRSELGGNMLVGVHAGRG